ncbi:DNA-binding transcriptional LysR family regulator [Serratia fonticola]|jgi:DNA-binding transcriptional LysR family regulator|uniref:DNA-binding transcriptional LysR family regulator n=1 Tax=Serratia fonticola TaxID=47917 RepID=A0A542BS01_SERFO|nr:LysR family transcriptional regulator [Serratia fonticola]TQI81334.1 DNA-binding transcriptional LysR family regulator [Serratia fonticola]TVZ71139.1 DNA-binding transcriptional LysR family regulator [Serratia fonticola]
MLSSEVRFFLVVANCGSLSAASEQLFVAISAVSRQIQRLETQIGTPLFERHARGMVLTEAGLIFENHIRKSLLNIEQAVAEIKGLKAVRRTALRVACTNGLAFMLMPQLMARFRAEHPAVTFMLTVADSKTLARLIRHGECDVVLQFSLQPERGVEVVASWPAPVLLLMSEQHPLADQQVALKDLSHYPLCLPEPGSTIRQLFDITCQMNGTFIEPVLTCDNFSTLYYFLLSSPQAVTICSQFTAMPFLQPQGLMLKPFAVDPLSQRTLQLQLPPGRHVGEALRLFVAFITQTLSDEDRAMREKFAL